jgi:hypothetical protein
MTRTSGLRAARVHRVIMAGVVGLCVVVGGSALVAASASAAPTCTKALIESKLECRFGSEGEGAGQFNSPEAVAVDGSTEPSMDSSAGDVYVADRANDRVDKFSSDGEFLLAWGWGVADGKAEPQTCGPDAASAMCEPGIEGGGAGQFDDPSGIAVNGDTLSLADGDVYVQDARNHRVEKFSADGEFLLAWGEGVANGAEEAQTCGPEAATHTCEAAVEPKVEGTGEGPGEFERMAPHAIAVDSEGTVYVGDDGRVQEFGEQGVFERQVTLAGLGFVEALAVSEVGDMFVMSGSGVREYKPCAVSCTGEEALAPRDVAAEGEESSIVLGTAGALFVEFRGRVSEFEAAGDGQVASFPSAAPQRGLAFGDGIGELYVLTPGEAQVLAVPPKGPLVESQEAVAQPAGTASVAASFDPEGQIENAGEESQYHFEYGETLSYGESTRSEPSVGGNFEGRVVGALLGGLKPSTTYHCRLVVTNAAHETSDGPDQTFTTLPALSIESESVAQVSATSARLQAEIDPLGSQTEYRFEYGRTSAYEEGSVPAPATPAGNAGSALTPVSVGVLVEDLTPGVTYHYRVVADNPLALPGGVPGRDETFTTQGASSAPGLIDGREWEMVSPADKHGTSLEPSFIEGGLIQAAANGSALTYFAVAPIDTAPAGSRSFSFSQFVSSRSEPGVWSTQDITTPGETVTPIRSSTESEYKLFSNDLSAGLVEPEGATPLSSRTSERTPYVREGSSGEYEPLLSASDTPAGAKFGGEQEEEGGAYVNGSAFVTASPDLDHVLLSSEAILTAGFKAGFKAGQGDQSLYEWSGGAPGSGGSLQLVSVLADGKPTAEEGLRTAVGNANDGVRHAISGEGTHVTFEASGEDGADHHLYLRDLSLGQTVQLDEVQQGVTRAGDAEPYYMDATANGSRVFFLDGQRLTSEASPNEGHTLEPPDLYMCEVTVVAGKLTCELKDLTVAVNAGEKADVQGATLGMDEAGRYVYFVAGGVLTRSQSPQGETAQPGAPNLYVVDSESGEVRLVAVLGGEDGPDWEAGGSQRRDDFGEMTSRVSADGRYLEFMSKRSLTGYDNEDVTSGQPGERMDEEVYLYHAPGAFSEGPGSLACVSCDPSGARPQGVLDQGYSQTTRALLVDEQELWVGSWLAGSIPGWPLVDYNEHALYEPGELSDSGRLFFDSADALVPGDTNGKEDVYEYEPDGVGSCALGDGCVGLISSGSSGEESAFLDASGVGPGGEEGEDVFFMTAAKLVPGDADRAFDIYDAHECSPGAPCASAAVTLPPACTTTDSCRAASAPQPEVFGAPAGATFSGPGNPPAPTTSGVKPKARVLTRAQKLAKALHACRRKAKGKRAGCERAARKRFASVKKAKRSSNRRGAGR